MDTRILSTKLPAELAEPLDAVFKQLGLRKSLVVAEAIREKIEDLLDAKDLQEAMKEARGFHAWKEVKAKALREGCKDNTGPKSRAEHNTTF